MSEQQEQIGWLLVLILFSSCEACDFKFVSIAGFKVTVPKVCFHARMFKCNILTWQLFASHYDIMFWYFYWVDQFDVTVALEVLCRVVFVRALMISISCNIFYFDIGNFHFNFILIAGFECEVLHLCKYPVLL